METSRFTAKYVFSLSAKACCAPAADSILDPSRTRLLQCLSPYAIKNVVFSDVWGVMAPMARLVA